MIGFAILSLVVIILVYFIFRPKPNTNTNMNLEFDLQGFINDTLAASCFTVNGQKAKIFFTRKIVTIGDATYSLNIKDWKAVADPLTFSIDNKGEYTIELIDNPKGPVGETMYKINTISGPYTFVNC